MRSQEIPTHQWVPFLNDFSKRHEGDLVTVELIGHDVGVQASAQEVPLVGVTVDLTDGGDNEQIEVIVGEEARSHHMHAIRRPRSVRLAQTDDGQDAALQIESEGGPTTLLRLSEQPPA